MDAVGRGAAAYEVPEELQGLAMTDLLTAVRERPEVFFIKSHRIEHCADSGPALYIVRDGRDVLVSRAHWLGNNKAGSYSALPFDERLDKLISSGKWSRHVRAWRTRSRRRRWCASRSWSPTRPGTVKRACDELGVRCPSRPAS